MFSDCTVLPDSEDIELGSSKQEASSSTSKNNRVVLVPCSRIEKCITTVISGGVDISEVPGCYFLQQMSSQ